jgi:DNA polymerase III epsilon subunit-like protein
MKYLFFDTETTGLPKNYKAPITDFKNWPRVIQLAYLIYDDQGNELKTKDVIIKPDGFIIPQASSDVHGISTDQAIAEGVELNIVLKEFEQDVKDVDILVAHNISFDEAIMGCEFLRNEFKNPIEHKRKICTMKTTTNFCKIPGKYGFKWPRLSDLHIKLFGEDFDGAHNALADIRATADCFWELKRLNVL